MKLIIDIPEEMYQKFKETNMFISGRRSGRTFDYVLFNAVNTGTPLDKHDEEIIAETVESIWGKPPYTELLNRIRAEIQQKYDKAKVYRNVLQMNAYTDCLQIIENCKKGR